MKKYILSVLGIAFMFASCSEDKLEIAQKGVATPEEFYNATEAGTVDKNSFEALNAAYNSLVTLCSQDGMSIGCPYDEILNQPCDDYLTGGTHEYDHVDPLSINQFTYSTSLGIISTVYSCLYDIVRYASFLDLFTNPTDACKKYQAEATVLKAWAHLQLGMIWGDAPIVDKVLGMDEYPTNSGGQEDVMKYVVEKISDNVIALLDDRPRKYKNQWNQDAIEYETGASKITKCVAYTIRAKAYMYLKDWAKAKADLKKVIDSGHYSLVSGAQWYDQFHQNGDLSSEKVWECNLVKDASDGGQYRSTWMASNRICWRTDKLRSYPGLIGCADYTGGGWGGGGIREDFAEKFYNDEPTSYRRKGTFFTFDEWITDPDNIVKWSGKDTTKTWNKDANRWEYSKLKSDGKYTSLADPTTYTYVEMEDAGRGIKTGQELYASGKYIWYKKLYNDYDSDVANLYWKRNWGYKNFTLFRYTEVLYMYAEACLQSGSDIQDGLDKLNSIRQRAGVTTDLTTLTMDEIKWDKQKEMWNEGQRFYDLMRWGDEGNLKNNGQHVPWLSDKFATDADGKTTNKHEASVRYVDYGSHWDKSKHGFFPFPYSATSANPNLKQHTGW